MIKTCTILFMQTKICAIISNQDLLPSQNTSLLKEVWYWIVIAQLVMSKTKTSHWHCICECIEGTE